MMTNETRIEFEQNLSLLIDCLIDERNSDFALGYLSEFLTRRLFEHCKDKQIAKINEVIENTIRERYPNV